MKRYNRFLEGVAQDLHIRQGNHEDLISYRCRIVYSALGRLALASLWDKLEDDQPEEEQTVSIVYFKDRIGQAAYGYMQLYPELKSAFCGESLETINEEITDEIYALFFSAGYFYHKRNRIAPCMPCGSTVGNVCFTRGLKPGAPQLVSGLGSYQNRSDGLERLIPVEEMFHLDCPDILLPWQELTAEPVWEPLMVDSNVDYLKLKPPFTREYWVKKPDSGIVSLCRVKTQGAHRYYLYQADYKQVWCSPIPGWRLMESMYEEDAGRSNYRLYSNSLLANLGVLPPTRYHVDGETVSIDVGYLFPTTELNLMKLYSWPQSFYNPASPFKRVFERTVFFAVKETLERHGYCFIEV